MKKFILLSCCFISLLNGMEITMQEYDIKKDGINLILSLDDVLLHHPSIKIDGIHQFFLKKSFVVQDLWQGNNYIVPAYLSEFLKFVMSKFNISFFNDDVEAVNRSVIENIWLQVFGKRKPHNVRILSRKDIINVEKNPELQLNRKKDVRKVGGLHNTILVDACSDWVFKGQESNFLCVPADDFSDLQCIVKCYNDRDKKNYYEQHMRQLLASEWCPYYLRAFYKLLYITGVLDIAAQHKTSIIDGLRAIQFENDVPKFEERQRDLQYYKRGYRVLLTYSDGIAAQQETILHLLQAHPEIYWSVLPPEVRQLIVGYIMQLTQLTMCIFPEIEKHFCS